LFRTVETIIIAHWTRSKGKVLASYVRRKFIVAKMFAKLTEAINFYGSFSLLCLLFVISVLLQKLQ